MGEAPRLMGFKYSEFFRVMKVIWYIDCIQVNAPSGVPGNKHIYIPAVKRGLSHHRGKKGTRHQLRSDFTTK